MASLPVKIHLRKRCTAVLHKLSQHLLTFRLSLYTALSIIYFKFMQSYAPLGIGWRPFHELRVFNAINHILNESPLLPFGLTSWDSLNKLSSSGQPVGIYLVSALPHWIHSLAFSMLRFDEWSTLGYLGDYILITLVAALSAEIFAKIFTFKSIILKIFWPSAVFILFLASPWSYRMMLAPWHEMSWLFFVLSAYYCCICRRNNLFLFMLSISGFFHWQWSFLISVFYCFVLFSRQFTNGTTLQNLLPPSFHGRAANLQLIGVTLAPVIFHWLQLAFLHSFVPSISHSGSSMLFRIGIDSAQNIHHGGWLAAFQFLGGNRFSVCLPNSETSLASSIGSFNCILSIAGWSIIALLGSFGYLQICWKREDLLWLLVPLLWSLSVFLFIFQQSSAVHLQGYSFAFAFIFAIGIAHLISSIMRAFSFSSAASILIGAPIISGILISAVRVSYFTNVNG